MFNEKQIRYVRRQITNSFHIMSESKETCFPASLEPRKSIQFPKVNFWNSVMVGQRFFCLLHSHSEEDIHKTDETLKSSVLNTYFKVI